VPPQTAVPLLLSLLIINGRPLLTLLLLQSLPLPLTMSTPTQAQQ
jgi:hypothetical protein